MAQTKATATQVGKAAAGKVRDSVASNELAQKAKDAAYTIVGLGVMGAQKATAAGKQAATKLRRDDATNLDVDALKAKTKDATDVARKQFTRVDGVLTGAIAKLEEAFAPLEDRLPSAAKDTVQKAKAAGTGLHAPVRVKVAGEVEAPKPTRKRATEADAA